MVVTIPTPPTPSQGSTGTRSLQLVVTTHPPHIDESLLGRQVPGRTPGGRETPAVTTTTTLVHRPYDGPEEWWRHALVYETPLTCPGSRRAGPHRSHHQARPLPGHGRGTHPSEPARHRHRDGLDPPLHRRGRGAGAAHHRAHLRCAGSDHRTLRQADHRLRDRPRRRR